MDNDYFPAVIRFVDYDGAIALAPGSMPTYERIYGPENPWVAWLRRHAPALLLLTPSELRRYMKGDTWKGPKDWDQRAA